MPFTWCDPDDANVTAANSTADCTSLVENSGAESGETRYGPTSYFDNVNDYAGFSMTGIRDLSNTAVAGLSGYTAGVAVAAATLDTLSAASGDALKITVTVSGPDSSSLVLQGWRTRYAPQSPF
jgi:MSHA pilin protein MshD